MNNKYITLIDEYLPTLIPSDDCLEKSVIDSVRYSLLLPGKRLRPTLLLAFCEACGGDVGSAMPYAAAVEMIHCYSLIHDDLPCMDDDNLRRGKPANHVVFGEDIAMLAGDALQALAYEVMLSDSAISKIGIKGAEAAYELSKASGILGMVGGQVIDLETEGNNPSFDTITQMYAKKTGGLIKASCLMGCILAGASDKQLNAAESYSEKIGLTFQIVDDILDIISDTDTLGKPVGSDEENKKVNYVTVLGIDKSREIVRQLTDEALVCLNEFDFNTEFLKNLTLELAARIH